MAGGGTGAPIRPPPETLSRHARTCKGPAPRRAGAFDPAGCPLPSAAAPCYGLLPCRPRRRPDAKRRRIIVQITVRDNNVEQALRALKKKLQREGVYREMKLRRHFEKPSEKKKRERAEAVRRARKLARKRAQREGAD